MTGMPMLTIMSWLRLKPSRLALVLLLPVLLGAGVREPSGYRMDDYLAPVPDNLTGGRVLDVNGVAEAMRTGAIAIDVLPAPRRPPSQSANMPWLPPPRKQIAGSLWWPEVGRGAISHAVDQWFQRRLREVTNGDRAKPLIFYCKASCWMSWNAAKRAINYGYGNVLWFPDGAEAWTALGYPSQNGTPEDVPADHE